MKSQKKSQEESSIKSKNLSKEGSNPNPNSDTNIDQKSTENLLEEFQLNPEDRTTMNSEEFLEIFAPFSKLYNTSGAAEKIAKLNHHFSDSQFRNIMLLKTRGDVEYFDKITIPEDEFLMGCGILLDASIVHGVMHLPPEMLATQYEIVFQEMQNGRSRTNKQMQKKSELNPDGEGFIRVIVKNTREFFDNGSSEWNGSSLEEKQEKLRDLYKKDHVRPSDIFFYHIYSYRSLNKYNQGYRHVLQEAPCSCFSLCFNKKEFLLPDPKMFYNQSTNRERLVEFDRAQYGNYIERSV
ncbi:MAG: hypothetical protein JJT78_11930 [Leptospira sp.]|nr:hypothetical protein [Leptospira sp.]